MQVKNCNGFPTFVYTHSSFISCTIFFSLFRFALGPESWKKVSEIRMAASSTDDIFEISDFTVVTDWEKFILELETLIHEWQLNTLPQWTAAPTKVQKDFLMKHCNSRTGSLCKFGCTQVI